MTRQLRTRSARPNYAALAGFGVLDDGAGPPNAGDIVESDASGSEFEPYAAPEEHAPDDAEDMSLDDVEAEDDLSESASAAVPRKRRRTAKDSHILDADSASVASRRKNAQPMAAAKRSVTLLPGPSLSTRQNHALPSVHHRHRSTSIYTKEGKSERLAQTPRIFAPEMTIQTNAWASSQTVTDRVNKSWGYNIGPGPLWELVEDRSWFKESYGSSMLSERELRPRVHEDVRLGQYEVLNPSGATVYLPTNTKTSRDRTLSPIACSFGPHGKQTRLEVKMFDTVKMSQYFPGSKSHAFSAGAPVWGLDWCPIHPDDRAFHNYRQYLAVAPFPSRDHARMIGSRTKRPAPACIQIWGLSPSDPDDNMAVDGEVNAGVGSLQDDAGEMRCEMVLCIDSGSAFELKWCPLPSNDAFVDGPQTQRKLGIIAGTFEDGSLSLYAVPDPSDIRGPEGVHESYPKYVKLSEPLLRIELEETCCWSFDWANSEVIAVGCTNGSIAVFNIANVLKWPNQPLLPTHYFTVHQSAIRSIAWARAPTYAADGELTADDPTVIVSGGYDGVETVTDIRNMCPNVMNRTRDVVSAMCFSVYTGSAVTIDHENIIKGYSLEPVMLGRGHTILEPNGPIWSLSASDYHPQLALGVTDGSCLTANTMRTTRRGGTIPFLEHKIYQLDYSRALGEYRMLEHFLPNETHNRPAASRANKPIPVGTGAWPPEVAVQRVVWNDGNGLARTPMLASATGSGLCRVDWLVGRWGKDTLPYNGIEGIRAERSGTFDEDEESD